MLDNLLEVMSAIRRHKTRSLIACFGIFWSILVLTLSLGIAQSIRENALKSLDQGLIDYIIFYTGPTSVPYNGMNSGRFIELTESDVSLISKYVPDVKLVAAENVYPDAHVSANKKYASFQVHGVTENYFNINNSVVLRQGRSLNYTDHFQARRVCKVGRMVADRLFGVGSDPIGAEMNINGITVKVVGLFQSTYGAGKNEDAVYIPESTYRILFGSNGKVQTIWAMRPSVGGAGVEEAILTVLRKSHTVSPQDRQAINFFNVADEVNRVKNLFASIDLMIWFVGIGTLSAGLVSVGNIAIIAVRERTFEIGLRKAVGATPLEIFLLFVVESALLSLFSGYLGVVFGCASLELISFISSPGWLNIEQLQEPNIDTGLLLKITSMLTICSLSAASYPALVAARILPINALRMK